MSPIESKVSPENVKVSPVIGAKEEPLKKEHIKEEQEQATLQVIDFRTRVRNLSWAAHREIDVCQLANVMFANGEHPFKALLSYLPTPPL